MKKIFTFLITVLLAQSSFACTAGFTTSISGGIVTFTNTSSGPAAPANVYWDFGDGTSSSTFNPSHAYTATGRYNVELIINYYDSTTHTTLCEDTTYDSVTIATVTNGIYGNIIVDTTRYTGPGYYDSLMKVWLITYDSSTNIITAIDSQVVSAWYSYFEYKFEGMPAGSYLVKAQDLGDTSGSGYVPTYYDSSLHWNTAKYVTVTSGISYNNDIYMQYGTATSGPGFIEGNVLYGAGKMSGSKGTVGSPVSGLLVYLLDGHNKLVSKATTDNSGNYAFSKIPVGTYTIYPEEAGLLTTTAKATITATSATVKNINFKENSTSIKPITTGIATLAANEAKVVIYPNPATGTVTVSCVGLQSKSVTISITSVAGQKLYDDQVNTDGNGNIRLNVSQLASGSYFINIVSKNLNTTQLLLIQH